MRSWSMITVLALTFGVVACSDDDDNKGSLDSRFESAVAALGKAGGDACTCLQDPQSGFCQANPDECGTSQQDCLQEWLPSSEDKACMLAALKLNEGGGSTVLSCLESSIATLQKCIGDAACGTAIGGCIDSYESSSDACLEGAPSEIKSAMDQCGQGPDEDGGQQTPDAGMDDATSGDDAASDDGGGTSDDGGGAANDGSTTDAV